MLNLKKHQRLADHRGKPFKCVGVKCDASFLNLSLLNEHIEVKHCGKRYLCTVNGCDEMFTSKSGARNHMVTHYEEIHIMVPTV